MIKLSKTSKMPCPSWSIPAGGKYCPGSKDLGTGKSHEVCEGCYTQKGFYHMPVVKNSRDHNAGDWKRNAWIGQMILKIKGEEFFRWFDSGDLYHPKLAAKILEVCDATPDTKHWLPTKMWDVKGMISYVGEIGSLSNVALRKSAKDFNKPLPKGHGLASVVLTESVHYDKKKLPKVFRCPAPEQDHQCKGCRACWDRKVQTIGFLKL